ncbi:hypothetical protein BHE74_00012538 [Ensete ventricosum]|nr:hypothetical protein BHE74_00012538 [Ensete ventricosum]
MDRRRSIEGDRRSEKKGRRREETEPLPSPPAGRPRPVAAHGSPAPRRRPHRGRFFSRARRRNISPRGGKDRGDQYVPVQV